MAEILGLQQVCISKSEEGKDCGWKGPVRISRNAIMEVTEDGLRHQVESMGISETGIIQGCHVVMAEFVKFELIRNDKSVDRIS